MNKRQEQAQEQYEYEINTATSVVQEQANTLYKETIALRDEFRTTYLALLSTHTQGKKRVSEQLKASCFKEVMFAQGCVCKLAYLANTINDFINAHAKEVRDDQRARLLACRIGLHGMLLHN